jgi:hypothetical protein
VRCEVLADDLADSDRWRTGTVYKAVVSYYWWRTKDDDVVGK